MENRQSLETLKGIGEKTALKLLQDYGSLEGVYDNIAYIKGAAATKLINGREKAFESKDLVTIYKEVPLGFGIEDTVLTGGNLEALKKMYENLEFYSFLKNMKVQKKQENIEIEDLENINDIDNMSSPIAFYIETNKANYHLADTLAMGYPLAFDANAEERDTRGFTSIR